MWQEGLVYPYTFPHFKKMHIKRIANESHKGETLKGNLIREYYRTRHITTQTSDMGYNYTYVMARNDGPCMHICCYGIYHDHSWAFKMCLDLDPTPLEESIWVSTRLIQKLIYFLFFNFTLWPIACFMSLIIPIVAFML